MCECSIFTATGSVENYLACFVNDTHAAGADQLKKFIFAVKDVSGKMLHKWCSIYRARTLRGADSKPARWDSYELVHSFVAAKYDRPRTVSPQQFLSLLFYFPFMGFFRH